MRKAAIIISLMALSVSCGIATEAFIAERATKEEKQLLRNIPDTLLQKTVRDSLIIIGQIRPGFTKSEVKKAWGDPAGIQSVNLDKDPRKFFQWSYPDRMKYVYFIGDRVCRITPIQSKDYKQFTETLK